MTGSPRLLAAILAALLAALLLAPLLLPAGEGIYQGTPFASPDSQHLLGTDHLGRDLLVEVLRAGGTTISIALAATALSMLSGLAIAIAVALSPGPLALIIARLLDALISIPGLVVASVMVTGMGTGFASIVAVITIVEFCRAYRALRVPVAELVAQPFFEMSRMRGEDFVYILAKDVWLNLRGFAAVETVYRFIAAIMLLSSLGLLGLGLQPPQADWGSMVKENAAGLLLGSTAPLVPGLCIVALSFLAARAIERR